MRKFLISVFLILALIVGVGYFYLKNNNVTIEISKSEIVEAVNKFDVNKVTHNKYAEKFKENHVKDFKMNKINIDFKDDNLVNLQSSFKFNVELHKIKINVPTYVFEIQAKPVLKDGKIYLYGLDILKFYSDTNDETLDEYKQVFKNKLSKLKDKLDIDRFQTGVSSVYNGSMLKDFTSDYLQNIPLYDLDKNWKTKIAKYFLKDFSITNDGLKITIGL